MLSHGCRDGADACEGVTTEVPPGIRSLPVAVLKVVLEGRGRLMSDDGRPMSDEG
jgi:hypothetical protein